MSNEQRAAIAVGLIVDEDGRILLQHRDDKPELAAPGQWGLFGGHVEPGEQPTQAFVREMQEELRWRPRHVERYATRNLDDDGWHVTSHVYAAHLQVPFDDLVLGEGQAMALFAPDTLPPDAVRSIRPVVAEFAASRVYRRMQRRYDEVTATGILVGPDGRFLLQHRDDKPDIANPGMWGSFGGEIEYGETPDEGFVREIEEELAWTPRRIDLVGAYGFPDRDGKQIIYVYSAYVDVPFDRLVLGEGQNMAYFAPDALPNNTVPAYAAFIQRFATSDAYQQLLAVS